jgi:tetratricopeptide (TPR) repeat protein
VRMLIWILLACYIAWIIYNRYFRPLKTYKQFRERALRHEAAKRYDKALELKLLALQLDGLSDLERGDLLLGIGRTYQALCEWTQAAKYYDQAFHAAKDVKFPYNRQYIQIIEAYCKAGRRGDALKCAKS